MLEHDLVSLQRGEVKPFDDKAIAEKKLYLFFFSANTSAFARKFTPLLVEYYNRVAPLHPEFETIFFSKDRSPFGMETYMLQTNMPWPAVVFDKVKDKLPVPAPAADLPILILVNGSGSVLSSSTGSQNAEPAKVTAALDEIPGRQRRRSPPFFAQIACRQRRTRQEPHLASRSGSTESRPTVSVHQVVPGLTHISFKNSCNRG